MERSENLCSSTCTQYTSHAGDIHLKPMSYPPHGTQGRLVINTLTGQWAYRSITRLPPQTIYRCVKFSQTYITCSSYIRGLDRFQQLYQQSSTFYDSEDST